ncbi:MULTISPECIES: acetaldehyde dehydrogenase (acetylating) [Pseudomonas]|uniref:Acetaldehyde dehydrogenase n=1 Tax=Pseudomonas putida S13.1.2 TaxID=1384061 RepID=A0AAU8RRM2_PSEPU|nr:MULTISPECIES: acetaldehyde dehydrogenase (acetylating) [Pseudomonas]AJQ46234.1 acetaldehyde dehydrogenase [Pseudomonas putida S13.1.2]
MPKVKAAIIGSGNIGTDLMIKIKRNSRLLEIVAMAGVDPESDGLQRAHKHGLGITHEGIEGLLRLPEFEGVKVVFDATSAGAHRHHDEVLKGKDIQLIDLTPAAVGPFVIPTVNMKENQDSYNLNMVTCGGQATIPIVAAVSDVAVVEYAEIIASIASKSAGPGTRANVDEFTETTTHAIESVGRAKRGKATIILNPAEPPLIMRDTVHCLCRSTNKEAIRESVERMVKEVQTFVPGYRLKQDVQFQEFTEESPLRLPAPQAPFVGLQVSVFLEVEGAAHYLPAYAGNLDIMTSAALKAAENIVAIRGWGGSND